MTGINQSQWHTYRKSKQRYWQKKLDAEFALQLNMSQIMWNNAEKLSACPHPQRRAGETLFDYCKWLLENGYTNKLWLVLQQAGIAVES